MAFDGNRDGRLDFGEQMDQREFQTGDFNHDGALNRAEFGRVENPGKFNMYDTNRDGLVDAPEYAQGERFTEHQFGM